MENTSSSSTDTHPKQYYDNASIIRLIEEIRTELEFIKDTLHINGAGPCVQCGRKWFKTSQTIGSIACAICNKLVCPLHMRAKCNNCKWRYCEDHRHICNACKSTGGFCTNCLKTCQKCGLIYCYALNVCCYELGCDNCPECFPVEKYSSLEYCSEHYPSESF
jgi:hypothetical protein